MHSSTVRYFCIESVFVLGTCSIGRYINHMDDSSNMTILWRLSQKIDACTDSVYQALFMRKKGSLGSRLIVYVPDKTLVCYKVNGGPLNI